MAGLRAPLSVRINDGVTDRHVTQYVRGLSFRKTAPGGFASASMQVKMPRSTFTDLGPNDPIYIYGPSGRTIWQGFADNPGTEDGPGGQGFDLTAMGSIALLSDESRSLMYIDRRTEPWFRNVSGSIANGGAEVSSDPAGVANDGLLLRMPPGQPVATGSTTRISYHVAADAGMQIGGLWFTSKSGKTDTTWRNYLFWSAPAGNAEIQSATQIQTTAVTNQRWAGGTDPFDPPAGISFIDFGLRRTGGATNVADDTTWTLVYDLSVISRRMDRFGTLLTGSTAHGGTATYVLASWVVEDLLGRVLTFADENLSRVDTTTWQIDQLVYPDGVKAAALLDDLSLWEPDFLWEILHSTSAGYVFNYRAWPTTARYEISVADGYTQTGADVDLCNRIAVFWTDARGDKQTTVRGASVPALGAGSPVLVDGTRDPAYTGRIRDAEPVTLPDGQGSLTNAQRIGDQVLAAKANPPKAATAVVKRPIVDQLLGRVAMPWEIEPGYLVRVRENGDVLRLTEMEYVDDDCATKLTLGEPMLTTDQRIARLSKKVA